jgi:hypothetical protein
MKRLANCTTECITQEIVTRCQVLPLAAWCATCCMVCHLLRGGPLAAGAADAAACAAAVLPPAAWCATCCRRSRRSCGCTGIWLRRWIRDGPWPHGGSGGVSGGATWVSNSMHVSRLSPARLMQHHRMLHSSCVHLTRHRRTIQSFQCLMRLQACEYHCRHRSACFPTTTSHCACTTCMVCIRAQVRAKSAALNYQLVPVLPRHRLINLGIYESTAYIQSSTIHR